MSQHAPAASKVGWVEGGCRLPLAALLAAVALVAWPAASRASEKEPGFATAESSAAAESSVDTPVSPVGEASAVGDATVSTSASGEIVLTSRMQPQPPIVPPREIQQPSPLPATTSEMLAARFGAGAPRFGSSADAIKLPAGTESIVGADAKVRVTSDAGDLLRVAPSALGVGIQRRTPIVNDPRIRGGRVGQLAASGSYWIPARIDLDTALSKLDSRDVGEITIVKGPYAALYGPGFYFVDVNLLNSPRYEHFESHGSSSADYQTNGEQWYGRQAFWGGNQDWGFRVSYGHRAGNDYTSGAGVAIPSSYNSGNLNISLGIDLAEGNTLEFNYLRLDQNDVEFPGMAFDIDWLSTEAYELAFHSTTIAIADAFDVEVWHNWTHFYGDAQRSGKRKQFPYLDFIRYVGFTNVDAQSEGCRAGWSWGDDDSAKLTAGLDFRYIHQYLDEIASGRIGFSIFRNANSPLPNSQWVNPGLFVENRLALSDHLTTTLGGRVDFVSTDVLADPQSLAKLGLQQPQSSLAAILGTDDWNRDMTLWSLYSTSQYKVSDELSFRGAIGFGQRPPSLTELYVAQSFMFLLQNGLNSVTGDPTLPPERVLQGDLGFACNTQGFRAGANGFLRYASDYITFENMRVVRGPPAGQVEQVNLKYVSTDWASFIGCEAYAEYDWTDALTPFATLQYVAGTDLTRNGDFATQRASGATPSQRVYGLPRGYFSGIAGSNTEPLPGIPPFDSRIGLRVHQAKPSPKWSVELAARVVARQDRVAASLLETPTPAFTTWDMRGFWQAKQNLTLVAGVENITNLPYREHLDFRSPSGIQVRQPGRSFYFGSEMQY